MPTGYTHQFLEDPTMTFEQWALKCTRAMGVLIHMRDDSFDAPIPTVIEPSAYYRDELERAEDEVRRLEVMTSEAAEVCARTEYERSVQYHRESEEQQLASIARHEEMRAKVEAWTPPTPEHEGIKRFMLEQIGISQMPFYDPGTAKKRTGEVWLDQKRRDAAETLRIRREDWQKSVDEAARATKWLADFRASLTKGPSNG